MAATNEQQSTEDEASHKKVSGWVSMALEAAVDADASESTMRDALYAKADVAVDKRHTVVDDEEPAGDGVKRVYGWISEPVETRVADSEAATEMREALLDVSSLDVPLANVEIDSVETGRDHTLVQIHGLAPEEIPASVDRDSGVEKDMAVELANDIHSFIKANYPCLDHDGVSVAAGEVPTTAAPEYPDE
ncbi:hypothetical protein ACFQDD_02075 [Halorubrum pallidum]|uniref:Uncharacterized protein n=1 Tax=Halorubrum pallidum TaxID=1526114 RepID=A0ABD5SYL5_9EURY